MENHLLNFICEEQRVIKMSTFVIVFLLLTAILCHAEHESEETARGCNRLNKKCNSNGDCCTYGERCISTGVNYYCRPDFGP